MSIVFFDLDQGLEGAAQLKSVDVARIWSCVSESLLENAELLLRLHGFVVETLLHDMQEGSGSLAEVFRILCGDVVPDLHEVSCLDVLLDEFPELCDPRALGCDVSLDVRQ